MKSLHDYVTQIYYTHGLFCASHPFSILTTVICFMLISFYPLTNAPLPGSIPLEHVTSVKEFQYPLRESSVNSRFREETDKDDAIKPRWYKGSPVAYIQQIVAMVTVSPWKSQYMIPEDAFRSPLFKVFEVLEELEKTKLNDGNTEYSLSDICFRVSESTSTHQFKDFLPQYSCLVLSPANFWQVDKKRYLDDAEILRTIFKRHGQPLEVPPYLRDILFGIPWKKSGISRYFIRNRQKTIMFAITIVMKKFDHRFLNTLRNKLESMYPETLRNVNNSEVDKLTHLHYGETKFFSEYAYLLVTYAVLLLYLHFSIRKIEMVKSKWGLALSAVVTVVSSLLTSVSICTLFGLQPTLNGGEIFPYLVMFVGLENVLVITKSVVSTPVDLDVKYRIAHGISREGWSITKNLATELIIVIGGFFTFVPAIQEFALFALVGLLTDFFLQMVFFLTVLSIDIRRMELSDLHKSVRTSVLELDVTNDIEPLIQCPVKWYVTPTTHTPTTKKHTRSSSSVSIGPASPLGDSSALQASRRLKVIDFLANTRMIQRIIMVCTVIWIGLIVYKSGLVEHLTNTTSDSLSPDPYKSSGNHRLKEDSGLWSGSHGDDEHHIGPVQHKELELWKDLSYKHWPTLFSYYNISLYGKFISILPSLHLSVIIDPNKAISLRHPAENMGKTDKQIKEEIELITKEIRSGKTEDTLPDDNGILDSLPHYMYDSEQLRKLYDPEELKKLYPKSKKELFITILLIVFSIICLSYFALALYHCICPRNYAKWRSRWFRISRKQSKHGIYYKQMKESVPIVLKGHLQEIECVVTDGQFIISSCLGGQIRVWDSLTGDCITAIYRKSATPPVKRRPCVGRNIEDSDADLYAEYHGNGSSDDLSDISSGTEEQRQCVKPGNKSNHTLGKKLFHNEPDLSSSIETNFSSLSPSGCLSPPPDIRNKDSSSAGYNFSQKYGQIYEDHKSLVMEDEQRDEIPDTRTRSWSVGDLPTTLQHDASLFDVGFEDNQAPSIWCISCQDGLIVAGCGNGRIEFWDGSSGSFKYMYGESTVGVTALCFIDNRIVAARLDGSIDFLELETFHNPVQSSYHVKGHVRQHSQAKVIVSGLRKWEEVLHINLMKTIKAHQQPVVMLQCEGRRVVSASHDHTLRVFRLEDCLCLYTLHGHTGKITVIFLDTGPPYNAVSGDSDGTVRLWDLHTGSCMHKVNAHEGAIVALTCTTKFVISSGLDNHLIIWERTRGCIIHSLDMDPCGNNSMALLSRSILVTSSQSCINLLDINKGEVLRTVHLGNKGRIAFVNQIKVVQNTVIVCDYASEMKVIQFPTILEKSE